MGIFQPTNKIMLGGQKTLEPVRTNQYEASFKSPDGSLDADANYHLRNVTGVERLVEADNWMPGNYEIPFPARLKPAVITLTYFMMVDDGMSNEVIDFWEKWHSEVYDTDNDLPGLFSEIVGSATIRIHAPGQGATDPVPVLEAKAPYVWPSSVSFSNFDRSSTEPLEYTVVLNAIHLKIKKL